MMRKMRRRLVPATGAGHNVHAAAQPTLRTRRPRRRRVTSLMSLGALVLGAAAIGVAAAPPALANHNPGYYTTANGISGYCVDHGAARPDTRTYVPSGSGDGVLMVLSWFGTHYGPAGSDLGGGAAYPGSVVLEGVSADSNPTGITISTGYDVIVHQGATPSVTPDQPFADELLAFANAFPGPWTLENTIDPGPYTVGTTYNGTVVIKASNGAQVHVAGIAMGAPNPNNVDIALGNGGVTDANGAIPFTFVPGPAAGNFSRDISSDDLATVANLWEDSEFGPPTGDSGYQRLLTAERGAASTSFSGTAAPVQVQPSLSTQISTQTALVGDTISDTVTVTGSNGYNGDVTWTLLGPVAAAQTGTGAGTCEGVSFTGAPTAASGTITAAGDNTYPTPGFTVVTAGCYTYSEFLVGNATTLPAGPTPPGAVTETALVFQTQPAVSTQISKQRALVGDTITDSITVTGSNGYNGAVNWTLLGPVPAATNALGGATCEGVPYAGAPVAATGFITAAGDNTYPTAPFTVLVAGCYTYVEYLVGNATTAPAGPSTAGAVTETVIVFATQPALSTQISAQTALVGDIITDDVTVTGSGTYNGPVIWVLYGPVTPLQTASGAGTCEGVDYTGAAVAGSGVITVNGDNTYTTPPFKVLVTGCYTYSEYLVGNANTAPAGPTTPGTSTETALVFKTKPAVSTQISAQTSSVGDTITDKIKVTGSNGYQGPVTWTLLGPVPAKPTASGVGTCTGVDYTGAAKAATGSITVNGDNTYTTTGFKVVVAGCYTYSEYLVGNTTTAPAGPSTPGASTETTLTKWQPQVSTQSSKQTAEVGDTLTDAIKVTNSGGYKGPVNWTLLGPVAPKLDSSGNETCVGLDWTNAPTAATGSVTVNGDNTYTTAGFTVVTAGCYTYTELLVGNTTTHPAGPSTPGTSTETVLVKTPGTPLATTGSNVGILAVGGLGLVAAGGALLLATKRRRRTITE